MAETPVVLAANTSSVLVDPLPDWATGCEETDMGLERPEQGDIFMGWFARTPSPAASFEAGVWTWALGCPILEAMEAPFPAKNMIAWAWIRCWAKEKIRKSSEFMCTTQGGW